MTAQRNGAAGRRAPRGVLGWCAAWLGALALWASSEAAAQELTLEAAMARAVAAAGLAADAAGAARVRLEAARAFLGAVAADLAHARHEEMSAAEFLRARRLARRTVQASDQASLEVEIAQAQAAYRRAVAGRVRAETEQRLQRMRLAELLGAAEPPAELAAPALRAKGLPRPELDALLAAGGAGRGTAIAQAWQRLVVAMAEREAAVAEFAYRDLALDQVRIRYERGEAADLARAEAEVSAALHGKALAEHGIILAWLELAALGAVPADAWKAVVAPPAGGP
ncbi:hypothetical protein [Inmirania thermothiophila]|uniref:Outer membrane efflux protein n=1 Tax=Inmirania thermothiophila TaxID=1750597 RepID=A0A3N1Y8J5_9GAMM|nr:hypothetical protein [Inmirania thermothiophila]ROR35080.1 hypothetical protein EDC57_0997 [Inmirania thermothiophila]